MTLRSNARIAGFTLLFYIAIGMTSMVLFGQATSGAEGTAAILASIAQHASLVGVDIVLSLLAATCALVLAVTFYSLTRDQDRDLAMLALCCRLSEGAIISAISPLLTLGLLSVATTSTAATGADAAAANALGALLLKMGGWAPIIPATSFAVGSTLFSYLFLRARSIPTSLAWLGLLASILLVVAIPLQLAGFIAGPVTTYIWIPGLVFEVTLGLWLIIKGVAVQTTAT
jgi:hypothetical protein